MKGNLQGTTGLLKFQLSNRLMATNSCNKLTILTLKRIKDQAQELYKFAQERRLVITYEEILANEFEEELQKLRK